MEPPMKGYRLPAHSMRDYRSREPPMRGYRPRGPSTKDHNVSRL